MTQIVMIDHGAGNIRSAFKAFEHLNADIELTSDPEKVRNAQKLVLPGVGAFGSGMEAIRERGLEEPTKAAVAAGVSLLGICVGMQFLFETSNELGHHVGLGLIPGHVRRFELDASYKVPHMGWNQLDHKTDHFLLDGIEDGDYCYFVHSYYCAPADKETMVATTDYGSPFCSIVSYKNIYGLQFHPEKSHSVGLRILQNYIAL